MGSLSRGPSLALLAGLTLLAISWNNVAEARLPGQAVATGSPRRGVGTGLNFTVGSTGSCNNACNYLALPDPEEPSTRTTDTAKAVRSIFTGIFNAMRGFSGWPSQIGSIGIGVFTVMEGFSSQSNPAWQTYKLEKYIQQSTDLLLCKMDAMVNDLNTAADQRMNDADLYAFNNGIQAIIDALFESCGAMNCLNLTALPPSQRSNYNLDCAVDMGPATSCPKDRAFDPSNPTECKFNIGGTYYTGVCDPNGRCYDVYKYQDAVTSMRDIVALFASKDTVNNFNAFTNWWDTKAAVALAKGALTKVLMLQQLIMLDGSNGDNGRLVQFAAEMANKLEERYNYTVNPARLFPVVDALSRPNTGHANYAPESVTYPFARDSTAQCKCTMRFGGSFVRDLYYWYEFKDSDAVTVNIKTRKSCQDAGTTDTVKCKPVKNYYSKCGTFYVRSGNKPGLRCEDKKDKYCPGAWDRCARDTWSKFVGSYDQVQQGRGGINPEACPDVITAVNASIWEGAYRLAADLTAELEEVKQIVGTLRNITATGGMPKNSFGVLRTVYPRLAGACSPKSMIVSSGGGTGGRPGTSVGTWRGRRCPANCKRCQPSWRCLQCNAGYRKAAGGVLCTKV